MPTAACHPSTNLLCHHRVTHPSERARFDGKTKRRFAMAELRMLLKDLELGDPQSSGPVVLYPLWSKSDRSALDYRLAGEALDSGALEVTEVSEEGVVTELLAITSGEYPILLIDGEELIGAKQNRIMNTDVLLRPNTRKTIPVSCVEQGRWGDVSPSFASGGSSPPMMRSKKSRSVSRSLRESGQATSDQGEVWDDVEELHVAMGTCSPTAAMSDAISQRRSELDNLASKLPCPADALGVIVVINGQFAVMDIFDQPSTLAKLWDRLIVGYASDAISRVNASSASGSQFDAVALLDRANGIESEVHPAVDLGEEWRFEGEQLVGSALVTDGVGVHLSVFPNEAGDSRSNDCVRRAYSWAALAIWT
jgi:hypothetical protein